jgi:hypothetical protein
MGSVLLRYRGSLVALRLISLRCQSSDAIGGEADMPRPQAAYRSDATDLACVKTHTSAKCRKTILHQDVEPSGVQDLRLSDIQFLQNVSTSAASAGVLTQPRPIGDIGRTRT